MMFSFKPLRFLLLAFASATLLAACGGGDDDDLDDRADLADPKVRFVHAVPGGPAVTLVRNAVAESNATNVDYKYGSQYYDVGTAVQSFSLRVAATNTEVATVSLDARRGNKYTLVALPTTSGVELRVIDDPYNKSPTSDDARVRVLNASANATTFDVYLTAPAADLTPVTPTMAAVSYLSAVPASGADSVQIEGSTYQLRIAPAGSKTPFFSNATLSIPTNADWLFITLPDDASPLTPNAIRVLLVRSDDTGDATDEILTQP